VQLDSLFAAESLECVVDELRSTIRVQSFHLASALPSGLSHDPDHCIGCLIFRCEALEPSALRVRIRHHQTVLQPVSTTLLQWYLVGVHVQRLAGCAALVHPSITECRTMTLAKRATPALHYPATRLHECRSRHIEFPDVQRCSGLDDRHHPVESHVSEPLVKTDESRNIVDHQVPNAEHT